MITRPEGYAPTYLEQRVRLPQRPSPIRIAQCTIATLAVAGIAVALTSDRPILATTMVAAGSAVLTITAVIAARSFYLNRVRKNPQNLRQITNELISLGAPHAFIREITLAALQQYWRAIEHASPEVRNDPIIRAIAARGWTLELGTYTTQEGRRLIQAQGVRLGLMTAAIAAPAAAAAVQVAPLPAADAWAISRDDYITRVKENPLSVDHITEMLVTRNAPAELIREVSLIAVKQNGEALRLASPELRADRGIVLAAVKQNGEALLFADPELRADRGIVLAAVKQNGEALRLASPELRADPDFLRSLYALFEPSSTLTFDGKKRLFMTLCRLDMAELKTDIIGAAINRIVSTQRKFTNDQLQSLIQELDLLKNSPLMADFLFHPHTPGFLMTLPEGFEKNKDLKIAWALSNLYLGRIDSELIPAFIQVIDSDKRAFKNRSKLKVLFGFLNQFVDDKAQASPRRERVLAIVGHIATLFKRHGKSKKSAHEESGNIDIPFDRMAILTIYDQCSLLDSVDLDLATPALQDALLDRFIPRDLNLTREASSSSSSAPDLRADLKKAIIESPHPAALIHYLATLQRFGELEPDRPGFELLENIARGDFQARRHTACSHPADKMTPEMRAQWETPTRAVQVADQSLKAVDSEDWEDLLFCGTGISGSCLHCQGYISDNAGLLGICLDGKIRMATVKNADRVIIARCIIRLTVDQDGRTCLFKEKIYPRRYEAPRDEYAVNVATALDDLVKHKAQAMGVALYTFASDSAAPSPGVELTTPPNYTKFDYSDVTRYSTVASFKFSSVHSLYQP